jgi:glycerol-3-phosphate dehydrogenase (NAD(P)+)
MATITIIGSGMMGTALSWPLTDNHHSVRLVGTPLDEAIIASIRSSVVHPKLQRRVPEGVIPYTARELPEALRGADVVVSGVSSFGVDWFTQTVGPLLEPDTPVLAVTKGLVDLPGGDLQILPAYVSHHLPAHLKGRVCLNAIGGPCTSHELAARRQSGVVFCGPDSGSLMSLRAIFATSYYHIWTSCDMVGVEVCAALKNAYALAVGLMVGKMEKDGPDGLAQAYNPQAAVFAQGCYEMRRFLDILGGGMENAAWLPGSGDLYVTIYGGRTVRLGRLIGLGHSYTEARGMLAGETLESVEIITRVGRALPKLEARRIVKPGDFPLIRHLYRIIHENEPVNIPWDRFFGG